MNTDDLRTLLADRADAVETTRPERLNEVRRRIAETPRATARPAGLLIAAAVALAVVLVGLGVVAVRTLTGEAPEPAGPPLQTTVTSLPESGLLAPGRYSVQVGDLPLHAIITLDEGWIANGESVYNEFLTMAFDVVGGVYNDACSHDRHDVTSTWDSSVAELVTALDRQTGTDLTGVTEVEVGGYAGIRADLSIAHNFDPNVCDKRISWVSANGILGFNDGIDRLWVLDINGTTVIVDTWFLNADSPHPVDADALVDTIEFRPL